MIALALVGPLLAGAAWAMLLPFPVARRATAGGLALAANAAAWAVFWSAYRGDLEAWRSFEPGMLGATVAAAAGIGVILAAIRVERTEPRSMPAVVAALAISASAVTATAYAGSLAVLAVAIPLPTLAVVAVLLSTGRIGDLRGLAGLAAADVAALVAVSLLYARTGSVALASAPPLVVGLLLAAAAAKAGAIPGIATWRLTDEPGALLVPALRGQGLVLAGLAALELSAGEPELILAAVAAAAVVVAGITALSAPSPSRLMAATVGAGCAVPFVALGLGGGAGVRAFLILVPPLLLGAAAAWLLTIEVPAAKEANRTFQRWMGVAALSVVLGSILGAPPGGGFPGTWLTLSLAAARGEAQPAQLAIAGAIAVGLTLTFLGAVALISSARPGRAVAVVGAAVAAALVYVGTQPVRLGVGWWLRVEAEVGASRLLPAAGAPDLPAIGGVNLLLALAPAVIVVAVVVRMARGLRDVPVGFAPPLTRGLAAPARLTAPLGRLRKARVGQAITALLLLAAFLLAARLVILAGQGGFL